MSHKNKVSLYMQMTAAFEDKFSPGRSKHEDKAADGISERIYSYSTLESYKKHGGYFIRYCKEQHGCRNLEDCRQYVDEWLQTRFGLSAYTVKLEAAALAKLYGCSTTSFIQTPRRRREDIQRSRGPKMRDRFFSEEKNKDFVTFCRCTGLRRRELTVLIGSKLIYEDNKYYILVDKGAKGGKRREAPVIGSSEEVETVKRIMRAAGAGKVFEKVPGGADVHGYRAEYATRIYKSLERPLEVCKSTPFYNPLHNNGKGKQKGGYDKNSVYWFRKDRAGEWLDKAAMLEASRALGHNRICVVGEHYIRK